MAEETLPGIDPAAMAAASAVAPDPLTAAILAKHAAGTTLTPQECGKLGAYKRKASGAPVGRPRKDGSPAQPSHAAPAAAAAAPDAYAGLDSTGVAMASAGEDLASGESVQDQADWMFGTTQADMQPTAADENWVDYQPDSQYLDAWA